MFRYKMAPVYIHLTSTFDNVRHLLLPETKRNGTIQGILHLAISPAITEFKRKFEVHIVPVHNLFLSKRPQ